MVGASSRTLPRRQRKLLKRGAVRGAIVGGLCGLAGAALYFAWAARPAGSAIVWTVLLVVLWGIVGAVVGRLAVAVLMGLATVLRQFFENVF